MTLTITHSTIATLPDQVGVEVNKGEWNANHSITGLGTGVETALGVNVGTAGAVVVQDGALGTPSSGNITNCTGQLYTLQAVSGVTNPTDSQTVYFGNQGPGPQTTAAVYVVPIPVSGTLIRVDFEIGVGGTLGDAATGSANFRLNNTTDVQISAATAYTAARQTFAATGLTQAVTAGDYFQIKVTNPNWLTTNPTNVVLSAVCTFRT